MSARRPQSRNDETGGRIVIATVDRFVCDNRRLLIEAYAHLHLGENNFAAAQRLAAVSECSAFAKGDYIVSQGADDNDFYLVLLGSVDVVRNGRTDRVREAGEYFGELALIDVNARRSAAIRAREDTVVAKVTEKDFARVARDHPDLWRCLAVEIGRRLRQRLEDFPPRNAKPVVFIGSSKEGLDIANAAAGQIRSNDIEVRVWSEGVFTASKTAIESLEAIVRQSDFAILVVSPDDRVSLRGKVFAAPRDNVIFELGLFMGALGRTRVFVLRPSASQTAVDPVSAFRDWLWPRLSLRLPTDLLGLNTLYYEAGARDLAVALKSACDETLAAIREIEAK
jgi:CRP/FNR family transcriptional regulator, cyclic AMP receptor protein